MDVTAWVVFEEPLQYMELSQSEDNQPINLKGCELNIKKPSGVVQHHENNECSIHLSEFDQDQNINPVNEDVLSCIVIREELLNESEEELYNSITESKYPLVVVQKSSQKPHQNETPLEGEVLSPVVPEKEKEPEQSVCESESEHSVCESENEQSVCESEQSICESEPEQTVCESEPEIEICEPEQSIGESDPEQTVCESEPEQLVSESEHSTCESEPEIEICEPELEPEIEICKPELEPEIEICEPELEPEIEICEPELEPEIEICESEPEIEICESEPEIEICEPEQTVCESEPMQLVCESEPEILICEPELLICESEPEQSVCKSEQQVFKRITESKYPLVLIQKLSQKHFKYLNWNSDISSETIDYKYLVTLEAKGNKYVLDWCRKYKLISRHYMCPTCLLFMRLVPHRQSLDKFYWRCRQRDYNKHDLRRSVRKSSWLARSEFSLATTLKMTYFWVNKLSPKFIAEEVGVPLRSVTDWAVACMDVCKEYYSSNKEPIGGKNSVVEIVYCSFKEFGKEELVLLAVESGTDKCIFEVILDTSIRKIIPKIKEKVLPGTTIVSNCWEFYNCSKDKVYKYLVNKYNLSFKKSQSYTDCNYAKAIWSGFIRSFRETPYQNRDLESYLAEYMWRKRHSNTVTLADFINIVKKVCPTQTSDLL